MIDGLFCLIVFIVAMRAVYFLLIRKDPVKSLSVPLPHWFKQQKENESIRDDILSKG